MVSWIWTLAANSGRKLAGVKAGCIHLCRVVCDLIRQVTLRSSMIGFLKRAIQYLLIVICLTCCL